MVERLQNNSPENIKNAEKLEQLADENRVEREKQLERGAEQSTAESLEDARHEALELAQERQLETEPDNTAEKAVDRPLKPTKKELDASFDRSMEHIQKDMTPASRAFSKVIHHPVVDKVSDTVGNTIARPNLIIAGGLGTLILCSAVYLIAKQYGYVLSGFEAIGTFLLGWGIGAVIEYARVGFVNQRRR